MEELRYYEEAINVIDEIKKVIIGKDRCITLMMSAILAGGHILIDDIPGMGKTTLAMAFARAMSLESRRTQFTPDVMPSDILGFSMYSKADGRFVYQPGTVMCNLFLADEINRTSPKTQSALLEVMEEGSVTVDGVTRKVPQPFIVIATQNPAGSVGTQLLPESQLDRFMICVSLGYPTLEDEIAIAKGKSDDLLVQAQNVIDIPKLIQIREYVKHIYINDNVYKYICLLSAETRKHEAIQLGVSTRGTVAVANMAKASAFLKNREFVIPDDVEDIFASVVSHRILLNSKARISHMDVESIIAQVKERVRKPSVLNSRQREYIR